MKLLEFKINKGREVTAILNEEFKKLRLNKGAIVSVVGAVDECCISNMLKKDVLKTYKEPMELSGTGEIRDGKAHIHCTLSRENNSALHGHLHWAKVEAWYVTVFLIIE